MICGEGVKSFHSTSYIHVKQRFEKDDKETTNDNDISYERREEQRTYGTNNSWSRNNTKQKKQNNVVKVESNNSAVKPPQV